MDDNRPHCPVGVPGKRMAKPEPNRPKVAAVVWATVALAAAPAAFGQNSVDVSPDISVDLSGTAVNDNEVVSDDLVGMIASVLDTNAADISGYHLRTDGSMLVSFKTSVSVPGAMGALAVHPQDVALFSSAVFSTFFDGSAEGVPASAKIDGVSEDASNGNLLLSFNTSILVDGVTLHDEDVAAFDGTDFSLLFDGSANNVGVAQDVDAVHYDSGASVLFLSFDGSASIDGVTLHDEDVARFDSVGGAWSLAVDNSAMHPGWIPGDLDALNAEIDPPDVIVAKSFDPTAASPGEQSLVTVEVTNQGLGTAFGVTVTDVIPAGLTLTDPGTCTEAPAGTITCDFGMMAPSSSASQSFTVQVDPGETGAITNTATMASLNAESDDTNNSDSAVLSVTLPDIVVAKSFDPPTAATGEQSVVTLMATNQGGGNSTGVTVVDVLPAGLTLVSAGTCVEAPAGTLTCDFGAMAASDSSSHSFTVEVDPGQSGVITNTATATSATTESDDTNNTGSAGLNVSLPDLSVQKNFNPQQVGPGDTTTVTLTVNNIGAGSASNVVLTDDLVSAGLQFVGFVNPSAECVEVAGVVTCNIPTLAVNESFSVQITVTAPNATGRYGNSIAAVSAAIDAIPANNNATATLTVLGAELSVSIDANQAVGRPARPFSYHVKTVNEGPAEGVNVTTVAELPGGARFDAAPAGCTLTPQNTAQTLTCVEGLLPAGGTASYTVSGVVRRNAQSTLRAEVRTSSATGEIDLSDNFDSTSTPLSTHANLAVNLRVFPFQPAPGGTGIYVMEAGNDGPGFANEVLLKGSFPTGVIVESAVAQSNGRPCEIDDNLVVCDVGTLPVGRTDAYLVGVRFAPGLSGMITSQVVATSDTPEIDNSNNSLSRTSTLGPPATSGP